MTSKTKSPKANPRTKSSKANAKKPGKGGPGLAKSGTTRGGKTSSGSRAVPTSATARAAKAGGKQKHRSASKAPFGPRSSGRVQTLAPNAAASASPRRVRETNESLEAATAAIEAALDKKALLLVLIDVSSLASYTDFIGIVSGRSDR